MKRHGNGGEVLDRMEEGVRAAREGMEDAYYSVRKRAADLGGRAVDASGRAVGFAKDHPLAIIGSVALGVGVGMLVMRLLRD
jgi:hypothetical protein